MLGNDIVDLAEAKQKSNWRRKGYLSKIFTLDEQKVIAASTNPDERVWTLWSMKEAAYKIYNRQTGIRNFAPTQLVCTLDATPNQLCGLVTIDHLKYFTRTAVTEDCLHTIAAANTNALIKVETIIYEYPNHPANYKSTNPSCVSHHGKYLALIY